MTALKIDNLSFTYPSGTRALSNVSLEVGQFTTLALLGSNGAGKSTLLDLLFGWKPSSNIFLFGKPLKEYGRKELGRNIALVPQSEHYNFSFTLLEYTLFGRAPYLKEMASPSDRDVRIAYEALEMVGMASFAKRSVTTLSGGESQLVLIARAIAQESKVLLLDEPTSALDPANRRKVIEILNLLHDQGKTIIFTTHDAQFAYELATHVAMLKGGKLLSFGTKEKVVTSSLLTTLYDTEMTVCTVGEKTLIY
ncbi:MAG: ABC transporter ATP-binding protein [Sphaerochaeta sp.]|nr:ABC transporter ATP-binding protein [Sphaerochaeta sp.]